MKSEKKYKKITVVGKDVYIGINVHKESWQVTAQADGEDVKLLRHSPSQGDVGSLY